MSIAMGNDFANGNPTDYPAFYAASINGAMSVAAVASTMAHASYSNSGHAIARSPHQAATGRIERTTSFVWQVDLDFNDQFDVAPRPALRRSTADIGIRHVDGDAARGSGLAALILSQYPASSRRRSRRSSRARR